MISASDRVQMELKHRQYKKRESHRRPQSVIDDYITSTSTSTPIESSLMTGSAPLTYEERQIRDRHQEATLQQILNNPNPTKAEVAATASSAYVQALMRMIDEQGASVKQVIRSIEALRTERESRYAEIAASALSQQDVLQRSRDERSGLMLQLQEERERGTRLLHENTVLYAAQAEQMEQLKQIVDLCQCRGRRLKELLRHGSNRPSDQKQASGRMQTSLSAPLHESLNAVPPGAQSQFVGCSTDIKTSAVRESTGSFGPGGNGQPPPSLSIRVAAAATPLHLSSVVPQFGSSPVGNQQQQLHRGHLTRRGATSVTIDGLVIDDDEVLAALSMSCGVVPAAMTPPLSNTSLPPVPASTAVTAHCLALSEEVGALRQQLEEQRRTYEEERRLRRHENDEAHQQYMEKATAYTKTIAHLEMLHEQSLADLVQYRHEAEKRLRDVRGQVEWLRSALEDSLRLLERDRRRRHDAVYTTEQRISRQYYPKVQSLQSELMTHRRRSMSMEKHHTAALSEKDGVIAVLQERLEKEVLRRHRVEERYRLEMRGVQSELDLMRQTLRQMERKVYYRHAREEASEEAERGLLDLYLQAPDRKQQQLDQSSRDMPSVALE